MELWLILVVWIAILALQLFFGVSAVLEPDEDEGVIGPASLIISGLASLIPLLTFLLVVAVVLAGSLKAVELGIDVMGLWQNYFLMLFFGNVLVLPPILMAAFMPPYPPRFAKSFASRACAALSVGCSLLMMARTFMTA